ncbi:hypothetical protein [Desulfosporosinus fructosivorans]
MARIKAQLRRYNLLSPPSVKKEILKYDGLEIDLKACKVKLNDSPVEFSAKEFEVYDFLPDTRVRC